MFNKAYKHIVGLANIVTFGLAPATTWAAGVTLGATVAAVPGLAWVVVFVLSTVFGLAALLNRLKTEAPPKLGVFIAAHMSGCWLAGLLAFFATESVGKPAGVPDFMEVVIIGLASYAGARILDNASTSLANRVATQIGSAYGTGANSETK